MCPVSSAVVPRFSTKCSGLNFPKFGKESVVVPRQDETIEFKQFKASWLFSPGFLLLYSEDSFFI